MFVNLNINGFSHAHHIPISFFPIGVAGRTQISIISIRRSIASIDMICVVLCCVVSTKVHPFKLYSIILTDKNSVD